MLVIRDFMMDINLPKTSLSVKENHSVLPPPLFSEVSLPSQES